MGAPTGLLAGVRLDPAGPDRDVCDNGLPYWVNHVAFDCQDIGGLERCKQRWLAHGHKFAEAKHEFIHSIYTRDPDGTLVEFTFDTQPLPGADEREAPELLVDDTPAQVPEYEGVQHRSPHRGEGGAGQELGEAGAAI